MSSKKILKDQQLYNYVKDTFLNEQWSPERNRWTIELEQYKWQ